MVQVSQALSLLSVSTASDTRALGSSSATTGTQKRFQPVESSTTKDQSAQSAQAGQSTGATDDAATRKQIAAVEAAAERALRRREAAEDSADKAAADKAAAEKAAAEKADATASSTETDKAAQDGKAAALAAALAGARGGQRDGLRDGAAASADEGDASAEAAASGDAGDEAGDATGLSEEDLAAGEAALQDALGDTDIDDATPDQLLAAALLAIGTVLQNADAGISLNAGGNGAALKDELSQVDAVLDGAGSLDAASALSSLKSVVNSLFGQLGGDGAAGTGSAAAQAGAHSALGATALQSLQATLAAAQAALDGDGGSDAADATSALSNGAAGDPSAAVPVAPAATGDVLPSLWTGAAAVAGGDQAQQATAAVSGAASGAEAGSRQADAGTRRAGSAAEASLSGAFADKASASGDLQQATGSDAGGEGGADGGAASGGSGAGSSALPATSATTPVMRAFAAILAAAQQGDATTAGATSQDLSGTAQQRGAQGLSHTVSSQISSAEIRDGQMRIELNPRGLGALEVEVSTDKQGGMTIVMRAENPVVLDAMRNDKAMLQQVLSDRGFPSDGAQMSFEQSGGRDRAPQQQAGTASGSPAATSAVGSDDSTETARLQPRSVIGQGGLDIVT